MRLSTSALLLASLATAQDLTYRDSSKRGLVFVPSKKGHVADNQIWVEAGSDLSWYYNYEPTPSATYSNRTQEEFEFVPMLWSAATTNFADTVRNLISGGRNITHVMGFNEPDGESSTGGSGMSPDSAAASWISQIEPLRKLGIKAGAPAVTGSQRGLEWLVNFFSACQDAGTNCTADFFPTHWYGDFGGLASHMGQISAAYPNKTMWITEYAMSNADLEPTQEFFNMSADYFDRLDSVERYSYFGSFRSDVSNVGPNAAMLDNKGRLTDIGSWYLGQAATGNVPKGAASRLTGSGGAVMAALVVAGFLMI
ncbi:(Trans)glycosidase [Glarea lozoyensis ATCC 20868]|uniref:(Trans)glycosidase n=1 Tax=Glarea lozoyensis (strain ATCC 20868 / MF5171) TaxID=1116229 RepID=S3DPH2_GLAL2|nr:(Trans)glycosidase [Glarea lozoyensis ATCC 20868]EPE28333.1 (Trans)glycosidase [Glarea lozoyensis ATCC 20868]